MRIAIASDHAGYQLKQALIPFLNQLEYVEEVQDLHCQQGEKTDYPLASFAVGEALSSGRADFGVLICGSGIGVAIAANKVPGIRAVCAEHVTAARLSREHNNCNVLTLGERLTGLALAEEILQVFLTTEFAGGRHTARVEMMDRYGRD